MAFRKVMDAGEKPAVHRPIPVQAVAAAAASWQDYYPFNGDVGLPSPIKTGNGTAARAPNVPVPRPVPFKSKHAQTFMKAVEALKNEDDKASMAKRMFQLEKANLDALRFIVNMKSQLLDLEAMVAANMQNLTNHKRKFNEMA